MPAIFFVIPEQISGFFKYKQVFFFDYPYN